jgi:hypothetical protein
VGLTVPCVIALALLIIFARTLSIAKANPTKSLKAT